MREEVNLLEIQEKIYQKVLKEVTEAYYENRLNEVLNKYGLQDEIEYPYYDRNNSKILVVGNSMVSKDKLVAIAKKYGINEKFLEFELDYDRLHNYNFAKLENSMNYSDVLIGPLPHKVSGIDGFSSFLAMTDAHPENYPKIIRLQGSNELKITKESFLKGLQNTRLYNDLYN